MQEFVLGISVALQFVAAVLALRLVKVTEGNRAWVFIAGAVFLMGLRQGTTLVRLLTGDVAKSPDLAAEWIALVISVLMVAGLIGIGPVFTRIRTSEKKASESQQVLQTTLGALPLGVSVKDRNGKYIFVNKELASYYGKTPEALIGKTFSEAGVGTDDLTSTVEEDDREVLDKGGTIAPVEQELLLRNGKRFWRRKIKVPLRDESGEVVGLVGIMEDVTERKEAEEASKNIQRIMKKAEEVAHFGSLEWDIVANKQYWSDETWRIIGLEPHEFEPNEQTFANLLHPDDKKQVLATMAEAVWGGKPFHIECRVMLPDGTHRMLDAQGEVTRDESGNPLRMVGYVRDITESRKLEEHFRQSQKMEAIGQLAGGVAHDFNNLLQIISGFAELALKNSKMPEKITENLKSINAAIQRGTSLTSSLLSYSRRKAVNKNIVNINNSLISWSELLRPVIGKHIDLEIKPGEDLWSVYADSDHIGQVLANLCINARDAMPAGGKLALQTSNSEIDERFCASNPWAHPGQYVNLSVVDSGQGMEKELVDRIFDPFFTTKSPDQGSGLGLSVVMGIVNEHDGFIHLESEVGKGTSIEIYLPKAEGAV